MSTGKLFGLSANELKPRTVLVIERSGDGMTTANMEFDIRTSDIGASAVEAKLEKGTPITTLDSDIPLKYQFLLVDSFRYDRQPGGYSIVDVMFKGADVIEGDFSFDDSIVYSRNNALVEESMWNHPKVVDTVPESTRESMRLASLGVVEKGPDSTATEYEIIYTRNGEQRESITDTDSIYWWDYVVTKQNFTYLKPTSEWTKSATGKGALSSADLADFGLIDDPPGSPGTPTGKNWLFSGATEQISVAGGGANSYSLTWTLGEWDTEAYTEADPEE